MRIKREYFEMENIHIQSQEWNGGSMRYNNLIIEE